MHGDARASGLWEAGEAGVGPFWGASLGMCMCVVHELGTFACARWWARENVSASCGNTSFKQACSKGIRDRCNAKVYVQVRVVRLRQHAWLRSLCSHLSGKHLRKLQALNMRTRSRSKRSD